MYEFMDVYFLQTGIGWAVLGAMFAVMFGGMGSARGIRVAAGQGAGVMSEKPELFGKLFVLIALPGTQGFYGFVFAFMVAVQTGLLGGTVAVTPVQGAGLAVIGFALGMVLWRSAIYQGETSAASINLTAKKPEEAGRAIILPALVETYAVIALLAGLLFMWFLVPSIKKPLRFVDPEITPISRQQALEGVQAPGTPATSNESTEGKTP